MKVNSHRILIALLAQSCVIPAYANPGDSGFEPGKWSVGAIYRGTMGVVLERQNKGASSFSLEYLPASLNNPWAKVDALGGPLAPTSSFSFYYKVSNLYDLRGFYLKAGVIDTDGANSPSPGGLYQVFAVGYEWGKGRIRYVLDYDLVVEGSFAINYRL